LPAHHVEDAVIRIVSAAFAKPAPLIERLGLRDPSAEQARLVLDRAAKIATALCRVCHHSEPSLSATSSSRS
jgi:hypothetical protein